MAGAIVPAYTAGQSLVATLGALYTANQAVQLGTSAVNGYNKLRGKLEPYKPYAKKAYQRLKAKPKPRAKKGKGMPAYRKRGRSSKYGRRSRKKPKAVRTVRKIRKRARKGGSVRAARKLHIPLGGFQPRKIIRLRDCMAYVVQAPLADAYGDPYAAADGSLLTNEHVGLRDPATWGKVFQQRFQLNNLRNFYCQGTMKNEPGPGQTTSTPEEEWTGRTWLEPPGGVAGNGAIFNILRPLPLSRQPAIVDVFKSYTVIGGTSTFYVTNNQSSGSSHSSDAGGGKIWYAYRVTATAPRNTYTMGDGAQIEKDDPGLTIPAELNSETTYQQLKETGRWRMGMVNAGGQDKFSQRKIVIKWSSKGTFGADHGKPGSEKVTALWKGNRKIYGPGNPDTLVDDSRGMDTCGEPDRVVWLQFIWGPQNASDVIDVNSSTFGAPQTTNTLQQVQVNSTHELYVSAFDPYPIQMVNEHGGVPFVADEGVNYVPPPTPPI